MAAILYDNLLSGNAYKVRLALAQLGTEYNYYPLDILNGETYEPWFLAKNPMGQVPVYELENGVCIRESSAILIYLAQNTHLLPEKFEIQVLEWLCFEQSNIDQVIGRARFRKLFPKIIPTHASEFSAWYKKGNFALEVMNSHLKDRMYFVGERYTIADIALYAYTHKADEGGFELRKYPAIQQWLNNVESSYGYIKMNEVYAHLATDSYFNSSS